VRTLRDKLETALERAEKEKGKHESTQVSGRV
jgi:hypothetical protein